MRITTVGEPAVSVVMGVYNGGQTLARAIDSILMQTFCDLEFIICDDGSTDDTWRQLNWYKSEDSRVRIIQNKENQGLAPTLNRCLKEARGRYIARMDDDDYSYSERLTRQVAYLKDHSEIAFVGCCADLRRKDAVVGKRMFSEYPEVRDFYMTQPYLHPTIVFRREALEVVGGYSEDRRCVLCEDYDLFLRLYAKGYQGANLQETLLMYTLPNTAKGNRRMCHRWNETVTRWRRFGDLGVFPGALPYVLKPLVVGLVPESLLKICKI